MVPLSTALMVPDWPSLSGETFFSLVSPITGDMKLFLAQALLAPKGSGQEPVPHSVCHISVAVSSATRKDPTKDISI
jgi:hypothetical protein